MGTKSFTDDYIQYLKSNMENLQNQAMRMKEFESRLLNKEMRNKQLELVIDDIKNLCNSTAQEVDNLLKNFTETLHSLKNVLMWKSQILRIPETLELALKLDMNEVNSISGLSSSNAEVSCVSNQSKNGKKCGTAKVCPMIKGHLISAPTIHLKRVSEDFETQLRSPLAATLSPIMEESTERSSQEMSSPVFQSIQIPLRRLRLNNYTEKKLESDDCSTADGSLKVNFTRRKSSGLELRKRYGSLGRNERHRLTDRQPDFIPSSNEHCLNEEAPNYGSEVTENCDVPDRTPEVNISETSDPLEGPSWLLDKQRSNESDQLEQPTVSPCRYVNLKRRNYVRSNKLSNNYDTKGDVLNFNDDAEIRSFELNPYHTRVIRESSCEKQSIDKNSSNISEESSSTESSSLSVDLRSDKENGEFDNSKSMISEVNSLSFRYASVDRDSLSRKSIHENTPASRCKTPTLRRSIKVERLSFGRKYSSGRRKTSSSEFTLKECSVNLSKYPIETVTSKKSVTPKREVDSEVTKKQRGRAKSKINELSEVRPRSKRRAAEKCTESKAWLYETPKWAKKLEREAKEIQAARKKSSKNRRKK